MTTYRERREARADKLREWAEKREQKAQASAEAAESFIKDLPLGQPVLVGHHSEGRHRRDRERFNTNLARSVADGEKAEGMRSKADNIEAAADKAIYSDDPDAIERLRQRIEDAQGLREQVNSYNASVRKGQPDESVLGPQMVKNLHELQRMRGMMRPDGQLPAYLTSNLSGSLSRLKKRLVALERKRDS